jgi:hypothetical protein
MPDLNAEYPVPGNPEGALEYPSTKLAQANQLQTIHDRLLKKKKVVNKPGIQVAPSDTKGPYKFATESVSWKIIKDKLMRSGLRAKNSQYFRPPVLQASPISAKDGHMMKWSNGGYTESFIRHRLTILEDDRFPKYKIIKSQWKNQKKVKEVDGKGFLPPGWRGDPTSAMLNQAWSF